MAWSRWRLGKCAEIASGPSDSTSHRQEPDARIRTDLFLERGPPIVVVAVVGKIGAVSMGSAEVAAQPLCHYALLGHLLKYLVNTFLISICLNSSISINTKPDIVYVAATLIGTT